tara:strand:- start:131 stop:415 length:285 start_codon:yes stop_codon:yes gene_type:complete
MKEPKNTTAEVITLNNASISIKARRDNDDMNPSGWSIIVFAPSASIRCVRAHQPRHLNLFIWSILALAGEPNIDPRKYKLVEETIHNVTDGEFK